jgi:hypothetical protein
MFDISKLIRVSLGTLEEKQLLIVKTELATSHCDVGNKPFITLKH